MPIFAPVFCTGIALSQGVDAGAAGARQVLPVSTFGFAVGQHVFACRASDNSQATYLGKVTSVDGAYVYFQFALPRVLSSADKLVVPAVVWQAGTVAASGGVDFSRESGVETLDSTGKELIHTRIKEARDFAELTITDVLAQDWQGYKDFVAGEISDGLERFVAAYRDGDTGATRVDTVKLRNPGEALTARRSVCVLRSWAVSVQVVQAGIYGA